MEPDEENVFEANIINSTVYIIGMAFQISTFAFNYKGHPYMESLRENRLLMYSIMASVTVVICLTLGIPSDMLTTFEIIDFPSEVRFNQIIFHKTHKHIY